MLFSFMVVLPSINIIIPKNGESVKAEKTPLTAVRPSEGAKAITALTVQAELLYSIKRKQPLLNKRLIALSSPLIQPYVRQNDYIRGKRACKTERVRL